MLDLEAQVRTLVPLGITGRISRLAGTTASVTGLPAPISALCRIHREQGAALIGEVVGFEGALTLIVPYGDWSGVRRGNRVELLESVPRVRVGDSLLGRVIDARGRFLDDRPAPLSPHRVLLHRDPISPLKRPPIDTPLATGIRTIDGLLTCGQGQRMGIFAGSGVGKSTLLGQLARSSTADVNVVVLVGERGREVREFLDKNLGPEGLAKSVVVVATSDEAAVLRLRAAFLGTAIAEYSRPARLPQRGASPRVSSPCYQNFSNEADVLKQAASLLFTQYWSKGMIYTNQSPMLSEAYWMVTSCCLASWLNAVTGRLLTYCPV
jgi:flagellum-specific ATP synthase